MGARLCEIGWKIFVLFIYCRQENATYSPYFHTTWDPPFRDSLYSKPRWPNPWLPFRGWMSIILISCPANYTCQFEISISSPWPGRGTCGPLTRPWSPSWGCMTSWFSISCPIQGWAKNHPATVCCQRSLSLFGTLQNSDQWKVGLQIWISCSYVPYVWCVQAI